MIEPASPFSFGLWRVSIGVLAALSISSFALSAWLLSDLPREQEILERIAKHLPAEDLPQVRELTSEMQLQSRLLLLLVVKLSLAIRLGLWGTLPRIVFWRSWFSSPL